MKKSIRKRLFSGVLALSCGAAALPAIAVTAEETETTIIYSSDFEDGDVSAWTNRGGNDTTELSVNEDNAVSGTKALCASGRSKSWNGPAFRLDDKCEPGVAYLVSAQAMGQWYTSLTVSFQYTDEGGEQHYENLASLNGNGWQEITDLKVSYTSDMTDVYVYFEGGSDNIYIDDFTIKTAPVYHPQTDIVSLKDAYADCFKIGTAVTTKELAPVMRIFFKIVSSFIYGTLAFFYFSGSAFDDTLITAKYTYRAKKTFHIKTKTYIFCVFSV